MPEPLPRRQVGKQPLLSDRRQGRVASVLQLQLKGGDERGQWPRDQNPATFVFGFRIHPLLLSQGRKDRWGWIMPTSSVLLDLGSELRST
jgi:hypothetical protein